MNSYNLFKSIAFACDPESVHHASISLLSRFPKLMYGLSPKYQSDIDFSLTLNCGLTFSHPIGLAAGLDKNAQCIPYFSKLPFGALEVGTVTPKPQAGNPKPRLFRLKEDESLLNRMGFNNAGMEQVYDNINDVTKTKTPVGLNLGKNKTTSSEDTPRDYQVLYQKFARVSDYLVVNVSSPNTPGLRDLQNVQSLQTIFDALKDERKKCDKPLFLKISPDMAYDDIEPIVKLALDENLAGLIATNTTINKSIGVGGVSGKLIKKKARDMREHVLKVVGASELDVIGVGGVDSFDDLKRFWAMGGKVMQLYSSFIFQGPIVLHNIYRELEQTIKERDCKTIDEVRRTFLLNGA